MKKECSYCKNLSEVSDLELKGLKIFYVCDQCNVNKRLKKLDEELLSEKDEIKVGYWVTFCCCHDGYEISSEEELKDILQKIEEFKEDDDFEYLKPSIFKTKQDFIDAVCICENKKCLVNNL